MEITKRNGTTEPYDREKIAVAIRKSFASTGQEVSNEIIYSVVEEVENFVGKDTANRSVEQIQDKVEQSLMEHGFYAEAKNYILYRWQRTERRKALNSIINELGDGTVMDVLKEIQKDLCDSHIDGTLSENIRREALEKFSYVSPIGAAGLYYHATAADFQKEGEARELFKTMIKEIAALAEAMGVPFERDMVEVNLKILSTLASEATTSMQRDVMDGKSSEIDGLVYEVVCMGERYHVPVPMYEKVAEKLKETL